MEYALYKGEECLFIGTAKQIAAEKNVKVETIYYLSTPAYQRRLAKRKKSKNSMILIRLDEEDEDENE